MNQLTGLRFDASKARVVFGHKFVHDTILPPVLTKQGHFNSSYAVVFREV